MTTDAREVVFEQAHTPTDDERELLAEADALVASWDLKGSWTSESPVGLVMRLAAALRCTVQGEPTDANQISDAVADAAQIAMHEFCFGGEEPIGRLSVARQGWKVAIAAALNTQRGGSR